VNRLWSRAGIRVASVGLLLAGAAAGVYLGQDRNVQQQNAEASLVVQADVNDMQLLKQHQAEHAATRAFQRKAEGDAAQKAASEVKSAAAKAHTLERKVVEQKKAAADAKKAAEEKAAEEKAQKEKEEEEESSKSGVSVGPIPDSCNEYTGSRQVGCTLMLKAGFGIDQFPCLDKLWKKESGWNPHAENRSSGAYGIPQALPGSKMASSGGDWEDSAATQVSWGLDYIEGRYSDPCGAWDHSESTGWY
jgi:hypothetical protein